MAAIVGPMPVAFAAVQEARDGAKRLATLDASSDLLTIRDGQMAGRTAILPPHNGGTEESVDGGQRAIDPSSHLAVVDPLASQMHELLDLSDTQPAARIECEQRHDNLH